MADILQTDQTGRLRLLRPILLFLALFTSPLVCCGTSQLLNMLPASLLPAGLNFTLNLFEAEASVENRTAEIFYLTPITTTHGQPEVIAQHTSLRQRDIPLQPNSSVVLKYDSADLPLSGIAVCRTDQDCRLLAFANSGKYSLESYESLPSLEQSWLIAIQAHPLHNYSNILVPVLGLLPLLLLSSWLYLGKLEKKQVS